MILLPHGHPHPHGHASPTNPDACRFISDRGGGEAAGGGAALEGNSSAQEGGLPTRTGQVCMWLVVARLRLNMECILAILAACV